MKKARTALVSLGVIAVLAYSIQSKYLEGGANQDAKPLTGSDANADAEGLADTTDDSASAFTTIKEHPNSESSDIDAMSAAHGDADHESGSAYNPLAEVSDGNYVSATLQRAQEEPGFIGKLFDAYLQLDDPEDRHLVATRLSAIVVLAENGEQVERFIVERALDASHADQARWAELVGEVGVRSFESRQMLMDAIPLTEESEVLEKLIQAALPVESTQDDRVAVVAQLTPFVDHSDAGVRAVAVRAVSMWGNSDQLAFLENGLQDPSNEVRHAAAAAAMMSDLRSDAVKQSLLQIVANKLESLDTREQAYYALTNYTLNPQEQQSLLQWEAELISLTENSG